MFQHFMANSEPQRQRGVFIRRKKKEKAEKKLEMLKEYTAELSFKSEGEIKTFSTRTTSLTPPERISEGCLWGRELVPEGSAHER